MNSLPTAELAIGQTVGETVRIVIDTLYARIRSGEYPPDSRLPSERALAAELGVSRNTVREALDVLETRKLIRRRQGSGSFVIYQSERPEAPSPDSIGERTSPLDHLIVRSIIEPEMTRLAVMNMTPRELDALAQTVARIEAVRTDLNEFIRCEEDFYRRIAQATRNPLLESCYELTIEVCRQSFRTALMRKHLTPDRIQEYQTRFNSLFNAIATRDVEAAVEITKLHLVEEQRLFLHDG
ncbi:FadR/GntR family transcriptional regulator [Pararhodobacter marinus]|uniref:FadR family transcriptional regulator n=1 Tax=Pararhodobacter marinus TaxID=2184063 RepID=A0A2U2CD61_9RHOB|nr:FadR/GntR family transcriptional regulator [Pararhodobacter marinus]PWE29734.1 FadR family transcriptional regulator [Pararhodobacter marinus]